MSDLVRRLRSTRADMLGTDDEQHYWDCVKAANRIEELESGSCRFNCRTAKDAFMAGLTWSAHGFVDAEHAYKQWLKEKGE